MTWNEIQAGLISLTPLMVALALASVLVWAINRFMVVRKVKTGRGSRLQRQVILALLVVSTVILCILLLPVEGATRNQLLTLLGLAMTAIITLSSTTFVANMMASFMLRLVQGFRTGDFLTVGEYFGRVTERGLFHTEIQTAERDLVTFPNLYLATHPITVIQSSGTIVSATVSLGYDNAPGKIEAILVKAAKCAGLADPFVHVLDLGDFSVNYRIAGFLAEVKQVLDVRSKLRHFMIDSLHEADVEIVSPSFLARRQIPADCLIMPPKNELKEQVDAAVETAPSIAFDKADEAEELEALSQEHQELLAKIRGLEKQVAKAIEPRRSHLEAQLMELNAKACDMAKRIETSHK